MFMHDEAHSSNIDAKDSLMTNSLVINDRAEQAFLEKSFEDK
jgi:hypothetical protein